MLKAIAALFLAACLVKADLVVLPNANAAANGNGFTVIPLGEGSAEWMFQWDISGSQFGSVPVGSSITAIGFRTRGGGGAGPSSPLSVGNFDLQLSTALNPIGSLSTNEASNIGPDAVTVLSGPLSIPANAFAGGAGPNPFYLISFTTPYTYQGGNLLFSLDVANAGSLEFDAHQVDSNGDTVGSFTSGTQAEFYNYPITQIQFSPAITSTPEPASLVTLGTVLTILVGWRLRVSRQQSGGAFSTSTRLTVINRVVRFRKDYFNRTVATERE